MASLEWERLSTLSDEDVAHRTRQLLRSEAPWRTISKHLGEELVQRVVDIIQQELDDGTSVASKSYRMSCVKCLRTLTKQYSILPTSLFCCEIIKEGTHPVAFGGFSDIWRGTLKQRPVCLKVLRGFITGLAREELLKKCSHETLLWRQLLHPNILPFLGIDECSFAPSFCLISPWMDNGDIISFLETHPQHDRLRSITDVARGMQYLHELDPPIIHADIKGRNILVTDDFRCCLADFGVSWIAASQGVLDPSHASGGTLRWLPPESMKSVLLDENCMSARDIYSFGCTVIEIYTGKPPFSDIKGDFAVMQEVLSKQKPPRPSSSPALSDEVWALVMECLNFNPRERPAARGVVSFLEWFSRPANQTNLPSQCTPTVESSLFTKPLNELFRHDGKLLICNARSYLGHVEQLCQRRDISSHSVVTKLRYHRLRKSHWHILDVHASYRVDGRVFPESKVALRAWGKSRKWAPSISYQRSLKHHRITIRPFEPAEEGYSQPHPTDSYVEMDVINPETSPLTFEEVVCLFDLIDLNCATPLAKNVLLWVVGAVAEMTNGEYTIRTTGKTNMLEDVKPEHLELHRIHWKKWCAQCKIRTISVPK